MRENEQQNELLCFILNQMNFQNVVKELKEALNNLQQEEINIIEELGKITTDRNVTDRVKRKFLESVKNLLSDSIQDKESLYESVKTIVNLIYNVRNNIFHGNKNRFELENKEQQIRLRIYAEIIQSICQLAIEAIAKRANCPSILKVEFESKKMSYSKPKTIELTSTEMSEFFKDIPRGNLFYPCSGLDNYVPLKLFLESPIETFYFADISYTDFRKALPFEAEIVLPNRNETNSLRPRQIRQNNPLIEKELVTKIEKNQSRQVRRGFFSLKTNFGEVKIPYPRFDQYELTLANGQNKQLQICAGDAFSAFQLIDKISVFFYRFDGIGEGGSNQLWFSESLFQKVLEKMESGGLVITNGGNGIESQELKLKDDIESFKYKNVTFILCGKIDKDKTRVWKIQK